MLQNHEVWELKAARGVKLGAAGGVVLQQPQPQQPEQPISQITVWTDQFTAVQCYPGTHWIVHQGDLKWGGIVRVLAILLVRGQLFVRCQDGMTTAAVRRTPARSALVGRGELRQQVWWTSQVYDRPVSCLKQRIYALQKRFFVPFVNDPGRSDVFVYSNAAFDWDSQSVVPLRVEGEFVDPGLCSGAGISSLMKQHKIRIGLSRGRQASTTRSTTFCEQSSSVLAALIGHGSVRAQGESIVHSISTNELIEITNDPDICIGR